VADEATAAALRDAGRSEVSLPPTVDAAVILEVRQLVERWKQRLGISERIAIEAFPADDPDARCSMKPARMIPEAQGLWDFVLEWSLAVHPDDMAHTVVHELVHLLMEPLREAYFVGPDPEPADFERVATERWETVVQRIADAYERAYPFDGM
jgi:hypothetical protein